MEYTFTKEQLQEILDTVKEKGSTVHKAYMVYCDQMGIETDRLIPVDELFDFMQQFGKEYKKVFGGYAHILC
ncbi:hypothetical protein [Synechococcus phage BUCT-ZZ01]|nr:hypothetical protein [Synechococcus phage BUCT-ZZ01]